MYVKIFLSKEQNMAAYSNHGSSRGDLGFIPNTRLNIPSRTFFGAPANLSKKGMGIAPPVAAKTVEESAPREPTSESMVGKRTEWLESQERKLTATLNETRSEQMRQAEQITLSLNRLEKENESLKTRVSMADAYATQLSTFQHWVVGEAMTDVTGMSVSNDDQQTMKAYRANPIELSNVAKQGERLMLSYPMEQVDLDESRSQLFMRGRFVNSTTAQISSRWVLIYEKIGDTARQIVSNFTVV